MEPIELDLGEFQIVEKHAGCLYNGKVMRHSAPNGGAAQLWCNGREWELQKVGDEDKSKGTWIRKACKYSAALK